MKKNKSIFADFVPSNYSSIIFYFERKQILLHILVTLNLLI